MLRLGILDWLIYPVVIVCLHIAGSLGVFHFLLLAHLTEVTTIYFRIHRYFTHRLLGLRWKTDADGILHDSRLLLDGHLVLIFELGTKLLLSLHLSFSVIQPRNKYKRIYLNIYRKRKQNVFQI